MGGKSKLTFTVLGCGNSMGTPTIGNHWGACDPKEKRNYRTRASAVIRSAETTLLIDSGPDLREQANR
jgi:phosphoribosyl 1,2-cyclic phosphate phosphodiesterase